MAYVINTPMEREAVEGTERRAIPHSWKRRALDLQNYRCAKCRQLLMPGEIEYDHILPLGLRGEHAQTNIQALCRSPCHKLKTAEDIRRIRKAQRLQRDADPSTRRKSPHRLRSRGFGGRDPLKP